MKQLFLNIYNAFKNAEGDFKAAGLKPIATIDRYRGQPLEPEAFEYFELPAVFIGRQTNWTEQTDVWQGTLNLSFHIVTDYPGETGSQYTNHEQALKYQDLITEIRKVLDGFSSGQTSRLSRSTDTEVDTGVIVYEILGYACTFFDDAAVQDCKYIDTEDNELEMLGGLVKKLK